MSKPEIVLIESSANMHGRTLIQCGDTVQVLSGCCRAYINPEVYIDRLRQTWAVCDACGTELETNQRGWLSLIDEVSRYSSDRPESWEPWGKYWFGFEHFEMKVDVP